MFVQNQIRFLPNHFNAIKSLLTDADEAILIVAFIMRSGTKLILENIKKIVADHGFVKLLCSIDMGITEPEAIVELLDNGVDVRVCKLEEGIFHPKIWLSKKNGYWNCLVGSANCSGSALHSNVEASVLIENKNNFDGTVEQALMFFEYLWSSDRSIKVDRNFLDTWLQTKKDKRKLNIQLDKIKLAPETEKIMSFLFDYVKNWIDISKRKKQDDALKASLWRGWYIIPDQDPINEETMCRLQNILKLVLADSNYKNNGFCDISGSNEILRNIFEITKNKFQRTQLSMSLRELFVRQEKNYLLRFGFVVNYLRGDNTEDRNKIVITPSGERFAMCGNIQQMKDVYTENMLSRYWGSLRIVYFALKLVQDLSYITFDEFSLFVMHAYSDAELVNIKDTIAMYRKLSGGEKRNFERKVDSYFDKIKSQTAKNVKGNYFKHAKYTISAIGWISGLLYDESQKVLKVVNGEKVRELIGY